MADRTVREVEVELFGQLKLYLGGKHGYRGVRGGQGPNQDLFQGYTKDKKHTTKTFKHPKEAAIALAQLKQDIELGLICDDTDGKQQRKKRTARPTSQGAKASHLTRILCDSSLISYVCSVGVLSDQPNESPMPIKQLKLSETSTENDNALGYKWLPLLPRALESRRFNTINDAPGPARYDAPCPCPASLSLDQLVLQHALSGMAMPTP